MIMTVVIMIVCIMIVMILMKGSFCYNVLTCFIVPLLRFICFLVLLYPDVGCKQFLSCFYCYLCPDGVVIANETHLKRCFAMCDNIKQYFSPNFATVNMDANNLPSLFLSEVKLFILSLCSHINAETQTCKKRE